MAANQDVSTGVRLVRVPEDRDGQRLDNFLLLQLKGAPRSLVYKLVRSGQVRINGKRAKADTRLAGGDEVRIPPVRLGEPGEAAAPPKALLDRHKYPERFGLHESDRTQVVAQAVAVLLMPLQQRLQAAPWLGGDEPCATDVAIFPFVRQFAAVSPGVFQALPLPAVQTWLAHWQGSTLFEACMHKQAPNEVVVMGAGIPLA